MCKKYFCFLSGTRLIHHIVERWGGSSRTITKYLDCLQMVKWVVQQQSNMTHCWNHVEIQKELLLEETQLGSVTKYMNSEGLQRRVYR